MTTRRPGYGLRGLSSPIYCDTIEDARECYDPNASDPIMVELDARPLDNSNPSSGQFTILEDDSDDSLPAIYANAPSIDPVQE